MKKDEEDQQGQPIRDRNYSEGTFDRMQTGSTSESVSHLDNNSIVFFGSGPVAARSLELLSKHQKIEAVVTKPKPDHHRGSFPVIDVATKLQLPIQTVSNKIELSRLIAKNPFTSSLAILIDFGIIVDQDVIDYFPLGIINSHFSLLPQWRGADPISFSILSGQTKTGVSLMLIDAGMDTGKLITQKVHPIDTAATTVTLTAELIDLSDHLLQAYLPKYIDGSIVPHNQPHPDRASYSRKLTKEDGHIDWDKSAQELEREIRAFVEWPKSYTTLGNKEVIITKARVIDVSDTPGTIKVINKQLVVACKQQGLLIEHIKPAGKQEMTGQAFLAGYGKSLNLT